jgi:hypothetical protein
MAALDVLQDAIPGMIADMQRVIKDLEDCEHAEDRDEFRDRLNKAIGRADVALCDMRAIRHNI